MGPMRDRAFVHIVGWGALALMFVILTAIGAVLRWVFTTYGFATGAIVGLCFIVAMIGIAVLIDNRERQRLL